MAEPGSLPQELELIRDEVIELAIGRADTQPSELEKLLAWLETDGWEVLIEPVDKDTYAVDTAYLANLYFSDHHLEAWWGIDATAINDALRLKFARERISHVFDDEAGVVKSICAAYFENDNEEAAFIGAYLEFQDQGGAVPYWLGIFREYENFLDSIKESENLVLLEDCPNLTDEELIKLWR